MICKTIKYEDFNGNEREGKYYFHMSEAEIMDWLTTDGDYTIDKVYGRMVEKRNGKEIIEAIQDMILRSYGEKSLDGQEFDKSPEIVRHFKQSPAYSALFMELATNADKAADFFNGIIPRKMLEDIHKAVNENPEDFPEAIRKYYVNDDKKASTGIEVLK